MTQKYINWLKITFFQTKHRLWKKLCSTMLWIDLNINHGFVEVLLNKLFDNNYELWYNTCYKCCLWTCDNFETFKE